MNLADVMVDLAAALGSIDGLRVWGWPSDQITPPAAVVSYPTRITFDETYGRGMDSMELPVVIFVGKVSDRTARDRLGAYCDGSGTSSVKYAIDSYESGGAYGVATVTGVEFDTFTYNATDYLAATFTVTVTGPGATS